MRTFLAIPLPDQQAEALAALQSRLPPGRMADPETFHITCLFLGDPSDDALDDLHLSLDGGTFALPPLTITGLGHFGHDSPRVAWAGVAPAEPLVTLNARLARKARSAGIALQKRRYVPHVTLARFAPFSVAPDALAVAFGRIGTLALTPFQPTALHLMASHLSPKGPRYDTLGLYPVTPDPTI